jgi:hypothetical protein
LTVVYGSANGFTFNEEGLGGINTLDTPGRVSAMAIASKFKLDENNSSEIISKYADYFAT